MIAKDKIQHFLVNMFVVAVIICASRKLDAQIDGWAIALALALGLSLGKEYGDSKAEGNKWDWYDILVDILGMLFGLGIVFLDKLV